jgi:hypothetical protein
MLCQGFDCCLPKKQHDPSTDEPEATRELPEEQSTDGEIGAEVDVAELNEAIAAGGDDDAAVAEQKQHGFMMELLRALIALIYINFRFGAAANQRKRITNGPIDETKVASEEVEVAWA